MHHKSELRQGLLCAWITAGCLFATSCDEEQRPTLALHGPDASGRDASSGDAQTSRDAAVGSDGQASTADGGVGVGDAQTMLEDGGQPDDAAEPDDAGESDVDADLMPADGGPAATPDADLPEDARMPPGWPDSGAEDAQIDSDDASIFDAQTGQSQDSGISSATAVDGGSCALTAETYLTDTVNAAGCTVLLRNAEPCRAAREQAGVSGFWLHFSCRVALSAVGGNVQAISDGQPDYKSNYFQPANVCYEAYTGAIQNPSRIATQTITLLVPAAPNTTPAPHMGAVVGMAANGVAIFGNYAAPGDDIYTEARTFDRCGAHPQSQGMYHYHAEPYSLTQDDGRFVGVMLDGYPIYGRKDPDGSYPSDDLDDYGGHSGPTPDSATATYHYHVHQQTSRTAGTLGDTQWFLTTGTYRGSPGTCPTCSGPPM